MKLHLILPLTALLCVQAAGVSANGDITEVQHAWARANYATPSEQQEAAFETVTQQARALTEANPDDAAAKVWLAIVLSSDAGVNGGLSALGKVTEAKQLLEAAEALDPMVLDGSIYTSLGSLYYQVPGWPIGFGDDDKAEIMLKKALAINPNGIDSNYFYGDYLLDQGRKDEAIKYFEKALAAPDRPNRPLADKGRRQEIEQAISKARKG